MKTGRFQGGSLQFSRRFRFKDHSTAGMPREACGSRADRGYRPSTRNGLPEPPNQVGEEQRQRQRSANQQYAVLVHCSLARSIEVRTRVSIFRRAPLRPGASAARNRCHRSCRRSHTPADRSWGMPVARGHTRPPSGIGMSPVRDRTTSRRRTPLRQIPRMTVPQESPSPVPAAESTTPRALRRLQTASSALQPPSVLAQMLHGRFPAAAVNAPRSAEARGARDGRQRRAPRFDLSGPKAYQTHRRLIGGLRPAEGLAA